MSGDWDPLQELIDNADKADAGRCFTELRIIRSRLPLSFTDTKNPPEGEHLRGGFLLVSALTCSVIDRNWTPGTAPVYVQAVFLNPCLPSPQGAAVSVMLSGNVSFRLCSHTWLHQLPLRHLQNFSHVPLHRTNSRTPRHTCRRQYGTRSFEHQYREGTSARTS